MQPTFPDPDRVPVPAGPSTSSWAAPGAAPPQPVPAATSGSSETTAGPPPAHLRDNPVGRLQPRTIGAILDGGFDVLRYRFATLMALAATFVLPLYAIPVAFNFAQVATTTERFGDPDGPVTPLQGLIGVSDPSNPWLSWVATIGSSLGIALVGVAVGHLCTQWLMGADPRYRDVLRVTVRRLPVLVAAWALVLPLKALGAAVCFIGVVFPIAAFSVLSPVIAAEGVGPLASIARTWRLTTRRLLPMIVLVVIGAVVTGAVSTLLSIGVGIVLSVWETAWWAWIAVAAVSILVELLLAPVVAGWASLAYLDLRVRTEGLDLELESVDIFGNAR